MAPAGCHCSSSTPRSRTLLQRHESHGCSILGGLFRKINTSAGCIGGVALCVVASARL
jgi:hypothetical protein